MKKKNDDDRFESTLETQSVNSLLKDIVDKDMKIELNPLYQRDIVWTKAQMSSFIESVMLGCVPTNIIFNIDTKKSIKVCVDGKQRLESIIRFKNNEIPVVLNEIVYYYSEADKESKIFTIEQRSMFLNTPIPIVKYKDLSYEEQRDIFMRVQYGAPLRTGEKIFAMIKDEKECREIREFFEASKKFVEPYLKKTDRKQHCIMLSELIYLVHSEKLDAITSAKIKSLFADQVDKNLRTSASIAFKKIFSNDFMNHSSIKSKDSINRNLILAMFKWTFDNHSDDKWKTLTEDEIVKLRRVFMIVCKDIRQNPIGSGKTIKTFDKIVLKFNKAYVDLNKEKSDKKHAVKYISESEDDENEEDQDDDDEDQDDETETETESESDNDMKSQPKKIVRR